MTTPPPGPADSDFLEARIDEPPHSGASIGAVPDDASLGRRAVHGAGATLAAQLVKFVLRFGSAVALGRLLDPAEFGIVAMVTPILAFVATLNDLGFASAIVQRRDITSDQVSALFWINLLVSAALAAVLMLLSPLIGWLYAEPRTIGITLALAGSIVIGTIGVIPNALLSRRMSFIASSVIDVGSLGVTVAVSIGLALAGWGYWSLVIGQIASTFAGMVAVFVASGWRPHWVRRLPQVGSLLRFGANLTGVNLATYFSMMADNIIVGAVAGKTALGLYERSYTLALQPLNQLMAPLGRVAVPLLSRFGHDAERLRSSYLLMLRTGLMLAAPVMIVCALLSTDVVLFLLGPKWREAAPVFGWICAGGIVAPIFSSLGWLFTAQDRTDEQLRLSVYTAIISIASFAIGVRWGAAGVAAVSALSFSFIQTPLMVSGLARRGPVKLGDFARTLWPCAIAAAATAAAVIAAGRLPHPVNLFVAGVVAYTVFWGVLLLLPGGQALRHQLLNLRTLLKRTPA